MDDRNPEVPSGPRPIEAVGTSVAAFVGVAEGGPPTPTYVESWGSYTQRWPGRSPIGDAVEEFFRNGGSLAWIAAVESLKPGSVRRAIEAMHRDVSLVAVVADPPPSPEVIGAAAQGLADRPAMLLVEGAWPDAASAIEAMSADRVAPIGATGSNVAVYWPRVRRPVGQDPEEEISPLGAVAGIFARTDATLGVFKAPAGTRAVLNGVSGTAATAGRSELDELNQLGVNVIRGFPGTGTVIWGARTQSTESEWRYVPVRRTALFLQASLARGLAWAVFEPNAEPLWQSVRIAIERFLHRLFQDGAFAGRRPQDSYFVKCDASTMTQNDIDTGRLVCLLGFAPSRAAEFVTLRIGQWTRDADHGPE
ncbi:phage tail sheath family protein [Microbacterium sp.]|uniref:phage tail sheath family protein n=1 Tax=Microbacterium sp. TaxID=51671 RepID=UPI002E364350|nr:phage tail sheath subtilisin-like domain-containing protein [Microbacterium sp.]HEX5729137.1 phage tail sheath subtilisin-like domain-containing protein [Microbacterium sp.]